jgi:4-carboxymuconolactone decarboxylase
MEGTPLRHRSRRRDRIHSAAGLTFVAAAYSRRLQQDIQFAPEQSRNAMNRILEIPPEQLTPEQTTVFNQLVAGRGRILGPYKVWIHSPTLASGMEHIGTFLNKRGSLSPREVEIGILVIARHWDADYVRQAHIREGKRVGLSQETVDALVAGTDPKLTDPHERCVYDFAAALVTGAKVPDARFAEIEKVLGRNGIAEVLVLIGYYTSVALAMKVHEVPIPQQPS